MEKTPKTFTTRSGIPVKEIYSPQDLPNDLAARIGIPGQYPFTRGVQKNMYRGRLWTMRQYAGFGSAEESNQRYQYLLSQGTMGLSVAFDLPTQLGYDPDHARSRGEVGKVGVNPRTGSQRSQLILSYARLGLSELKSPIMIKFF